MPFVLTPSRNKTLAVPEPTGAGNQLASVGPATHYGQQAHDFASRAHNLGDRVQDLLRRLEA